MLVVEEQPAERIQHGHAEELPDEGHFPHGHAEELPDEVKGGFSIQASGQGSNASPTCFQSN